MTDDVGNLALSWEYVSCPKCKQAAGIKCATPTRMNHSERVRAAILARTGKERTAT